MSDIVDQPAPVHRDGVASVQAMVRADGGPTMEELVNRHRAVRESRPR